MRISPPDFNPSSNDDLLLAYVADLEIEVDRQRKQAQFLRQETEDAVGRMQAVLYETASPDELSAGISSALGEFMALLQDVQESLEYDPTGDQVAAIVVRPLVEQVFCRQQRLLEASHATLHLELTIESFNWFPARFRHILDNLVSNALKYRDAAKGESRVLVTINRIANATELRVTDNGVGMPWDNRSEAFELFYRSTPNRPAELGVGLAVVKLLVEQSGGSLTVESGQGKGTNFIAVLPRFEVGDYLT
jgi:signal transduction histidine kinase